MPSLIRHFCARILMTVSFRHSLLWYRWGRNGTDGLMFGTETLRQWNSLSRKRMFSRYRRNQEKTKQLLSASRRWLWRASNIGLSRFLQFWDSLAIIQKYPDPNLQVSQETGKHSLPTEYTQPTKL